MSSVLGPAVLSVLLALTACSPSDDTPIPVEADGGIGGPGDPVVTSNLILSGDQVAIGDTCRVADDPPVYRLAGEDGTTLTVDTGEQRATLGTASATFTSSDDDPPTMSTSRGAVVVQGRVVAPDGEERFVDATIGTTDLEPCDP